MIMMIDHHYTSSSSHDALRGGVVVGGGDLYIQYPFISFLLPIFMCSPGFFSSVGLTIWHISVSPD